MLFRAKVIPSAFLINAAYIRLSAAEKADIIVAANAGRKSS
jgi:hypothetical protein